MRDEIDNDNSWTYDYIRLAWDSGFCFTNQKTASLVNLNSLCLVDVDKTIAERDIANVEKHINTIINYNLEDEQARVLDGTFVKVFKIGQLAVQYLLFCKKYLDNTVTMLKKEMHELQLENKNLIDEVDNQRQDILKLNKKLKKMIDMQQMVPEEAYRCNQCSKIFSTEEFLANHIKRRHESLPIFQTEADKLQMEIKELKERLNSTEKYIQFDIPVTKEPNNDVHEVKDVKFIEIQSEVEKLKLHLDNQTKIIEEQKSYQEKYEKWMEMAFKKFETKQLEIIDKKFIQEQSQNHREIWTQTLENQTQMPEILSEDLQVNEVKKDENLQNIKAELIKLQGEIEIDAKSRFQQLEGFLEEKVTDKFEKFAKQMETFCKKIEDVQLKNKSNTEEINQLKVKSNQLIVVPQEDKSNNLQSDKSLAGTKRRENKESTESDGSSLRSVKPQIKSVAIQKTANKGVNIVEKEAEKTEKHSYPKVQIIKSAALNVDDWSSDLEQDSSNAQIYPSVKPSATSTLAQHSITSLKRVAHDVTVTSGLTKEIESIVNNRLQNLGISPDWKGLPQESYDRAMEVIKHQANLITKKVPKFTKIKKDIVRSVERKVISENLEKFKEKVKPNRKAKSSLMYESSDDAGHSVNVSYTKSANFKLLGKEGKSTKKRSTAVDSSNGVINDSDSLGAGDELIRNNKLQVKEKSSEKQSKGDFLKNSRFEEVPRSFEQISSEINQERRESNLETRGSNATSKDLKLLPKPVEKDGVKSPRNSKQSSKDFNEPSQSPRDSGESQSDSDVALNEPAEKLLSSVQSFKTKKKVIFDLESKSNTSGDSEKTIEQTVKEKGSKKIYEKPVYIDELKGVFNSKSKSNDTTIESISIDEHDNKDNKDNKDSYASDFDFSEILNE